MLKRLLFVVLMLLASIAQAAVYSLPWGPKPQFVDANGAPMSSGTLSTFLATSTTPQVTYTDQTGGVANPTTITLNTRGETPNEVWLTGGVSYKFVLKDSSGSTIWTVDNVSGVNDVTSALSEWVSGPTPTFVSATSFTMAGDQTTTFTVGRRIKTTNSGGTVYSTIASSVFGVTTTVTVVNDSSVLDNGLSAVSYGLLQATNKSVPPFDGVTYLTTVAGTNTITASASKSAAPLVTGQAFRFTPANTNTAATTLNVNALGAKNVFFNGAACSGGELVQSVPVEVVYDGTQFQIQGPTVGTRVTNALSASVALNNTANYFDGPSVAQGTVGTWFASGTVTVTDTGANTNYLAKLWDGTTVIASAKLNATTASGSGVIALSGYITNPVGNIRISVRDISANTGVIEFNVSGSSKDSVLTAIRIQ